MGSVTSALTRTRNALVKVGSEPENHDPERSQSAPESDRSRKRSARFNVPSPAARQSSRPSLSEVLSRAESDGVKQTNQKKTSDSQLKCESNMFSSTQIYSCLKSMFECSAIQRHQFIVQMNETLF